jgi:hypothetical protein
MAAGLLFYAQMGKNVQKNRGSKILNQCQVFEPFLRSYFFTASLN